MLPKCWKDLTADSVPDRDLVDALAIIGAIHERLQARLIQSAAKTESQAKPDDRPLTAGEVAEYLQRSRRWVYDNKNDLPGFRKVKVGRRGLRFVHESRR